MPFQVLLTRSAASDLDEICDYLERHRGPERVGRLLDRLERALGGLADLPHRGGYPIELSSLGVHDYRQVLLGSYRVIYQVMDDSVYVLLIADARRDMQTLLQRRLLRPRR